MISRVEFTDAGRELRDQLASGVEGYGPDGRAARFRMDQPGEVQVIYSRPEPSATMPLETFVVGLGASLAEQQGRPAPDQYEIDVMMSSVELAWRDVHLVNQAAYVERLSPRADDPLIVPQFEAAVSSHVQANDRLMESYADFLKAYERYQYTQLPGVGVA